MSVKREERPIVIYQVRTGLGEDPTEILTRLTHHVWKSYEERNGGSRLDPHLWPEVFRTFREAFKNRLSFHPQCGHFDRCRDIPCVFCGKNPHSHSAFRKVYLLELRRPLAGFLHAVALGLTRRLRLAGVPRLEGGQALHTLLEESIVETLKTHFFMSSTCVSCPARESLGDRRIWARDLLETPWGAWRNVLPDEAARGIDREDP